MNFRPLFYDFCCCKQKNVKVYVNYSSFHYIGLCKRRDGWAMDHGHSPSVQLFLLSRAENRRRIQCTLCPHNISLVRHMYILHEMLCGHCADIVPTLCGHISPGIYFRQMSALYPSSVFSSGIDSADDNNPSVPRILGPSIPHLVRPLASSFFR